MLLCLGRGILPKHPLYGVTVVGGESENGNINPHTLRKCPQHQHKETVPLDLELKTKNLFSRIVSKQEVSRLLQ